MTDVEVEVTPEAEAVAKLALLAYDGVLHIVINHPKKVSAGLVVAGVLGLLYSINKKSSNSHSLYKK